MRITRIYFSAILLLVLPVCIISCKHQAIVKEFKLTGSSLPPTFLLGSHLCRIPMPSTKEMLADMENLKTHGFNLIKFKPTGLLMNPWKANMNLNDTIPGTTCERFGHVCIYGLYTGTGSCLVVRKISRLPYGRTKWVAN